MTDDEESRLVELARTAGSRSPADADAFFTALYHELRSRARARARRRDDRSHDDHDTTALVHEAYLRLVRKEYDSTEHFLATASKAMRCVLVDHARRRQRMKRDHEGRRFVLDEWIDSLAAPDGRSVDLLVFEEVLERLEERSPDAARLVELRFFGSLTVAECAEELGVPLRTLETRWKTTRAWLASQLSSDA